MLTKALFSRVLFEPAKGGASELLILSSRATPSMASYHLDALRAAKLNVSIQLILGMCPLEGVGQSQHQGFTHLVEHAYPETFRCSYLASMPPVHARLYVWLKRGVPTIAFSGSANYTQACFLGSQREVIVETDAAIAEKYIQSIVSQTIYCENASAEQEIVIYDEKTFEYKQTYGRVTQELIAGIEAIDLSSRGLPNVRVSLLDKDGELPQTSGLNWGQRVGRNKNQAYIKLPSTVSSTNFFPPIAEHFTLMTDDGKTLLCTRAQQNGKAIQTPRDNSQMGEYFRHRLGLSSGARITTDDLRAYGRTDVEFFRIDPETFMMVFSAPK